MFLDVKQAQWVIIMRSEYVYLPSQDPLMPFGTSLRSKPEVGWVAGRENEGNTISGLS